MKPAGTGSFDDTYLLGGSPRRPRAGMQGYKCQTRTVWARRHLHIATMQKGVPPTNRTRTVLPILERGYVQHTIPVLPGRLLFQQILLRG